MTKDEAVKAFPMMTANWNFLDFSDQTTFDVWYEALKSYHEAEVRQGIMDAIKHLQHTPVVADILEYVEAVHSGTRRKEAEADARKAFSDAVRCKACNDYGYLNIIYPDGTEAIRPCSCQAGQKRFGTEVFAAVDQGMPRWQQEQYFGKDKSERDYKLIRVLPTDQMVSTGKQYKGTGDRVFQLKKRLFVPYHPTGRPHDPVYGMYVER